MPVNQAWKIISPHENSSVESSSKWNTLPPFAETKWINFVTYSPFPRVFYIIPKGTGKEPFKYAEQNG